MNLKETTHLVLALTVAFTLCYGGGSVADTTTQDSAPEKHSVAEWLQIALDETKQQKAWDDAHPDIAALLSGAGHVAVKMYGGEPVTKTESGTPEFNAWWKSKGAAGLEQWAKDDFPMTMDPECLIDNVLAIYCASATPRTSKTIFVNGYSFSDPAKLWAYTDRIKKSGEEVYRRGFSGQELSRPDYNLLRLYAPIVYNMWGDPYLPSDIGLTAGDVNHYPTEGTKTVDVTLPRLEPALKDPAFTDAYAFDYRRAFHSEIAAFLLYICNGYVPLPANERVPGGPSIKAKPYDGPYRDSLVTLSASRGKKPVLVVLNDPIDGYWASTIPLLEPLYQATKDKIDWYFICDNIGDNIFWNVIYFPPNEGAQTMQKAMSLEERARIAKNSFCMSDVNLTLPILLDDMAQHAEAAFADQGGIAKVILLDKNGVVALNSQLMPDPKQYMQRGVFGYQLFAQDHALVSANVRTLLDNGGIWNGKPALVPDWAPSAHLENVKITKVDASGGTITMPGSDGKDFVLTVDGGTRIIFDTEPDVRKSLGDLAVGMTVTCTYDPNTAGTGHLARLILNLKPGEVFNDYMTYPNGLGPVWCPAVVTAIGDATITASLVSRAESEMQGLKFWTEREAEPGAAPLTWEIKTVKDWIENPAKSLTLHIDRATEVILNGMKAKLADVKVGDHLGVETRPDQTTENLRPFFIFVYRYQAP